MTVNRDLLVQRRPEPSRKNVAADNRPNYAPRQTGYFELTQITR